MRAKTFMQQAYFLENNPFPETAIVSWGSADDRSNGSLFDKDVIPDKYEDAVTKFIVNPVDSASKFHFLWSLGTAREARGYGKTALLHYLARTVNKDLGYSLLAAHGFSPDEARKTPVLAAMATFDRNQITTLAGVSLEQSKYLLKDDGSGEVPMVRLRRRLVDLLRREAGLEMGTDNDEALIPDAIREHIGTADRSINGKTVGTIDKKFIDHFANERFPQLLEYVNQLTARAGYVLLHTIFVIARATGVRRIFLLIDQVEDFASADVPKKRRYMEVERFRDLAIETQPFGEMASYVLTMHPDAAREIEGYWSLARLPKIDHMSRQNARVTVELRELGTVEEATKLVLPYLSRFRATGAPPDPLFPFDAAAIEVIRKRCGGRPGEILRQANAIIAYAVDAQLSRIGSSEVEEYLGQDEAPSRRRQIRSTIGSIE